jgi:hypothetical protein
MLDEDYTSSDVTMYCHSTPDLILLAWGEGTHWVFSKEKLTLSFSWQGQLDGNLPLLGRV